MTIILVTHAPDVAAHAHRIVEMRDGIIIDGNGPQSISIPGARHRQPCDGPAHAWFPAMRSASRNQRSLDVVDPLPHMLPEGSVRHPAANQLQPGRKAAPQHQGNQDERTFPNLITTQGGS